MVEWKDGDIYARRTDGGPPIYKVIVKKHRKSAIVLRIHPRPPEEFSFPVNARGEGYVGAGYLYSESQYALDDSELVRSMDDEEYERLIIAVANALGLVAEVGPAPEEDPQKDGESLIPKETAVSVPSEPVTGEVAVESVFYPIELARVKAERDVYKELTHELLKGRGLKK